MKSCLALRDNNVNKSEFTLRCQLSLPQLITHRSQWSKDTFLLFQIVTFSWKPRHDISSTRSGRRSLVIYCCNLQHMAIPQAEWDKFHIAISNRDTSFSRIVEGLPPTLNRRWRGLSWTSCSKTTRRQDKEEMKEMTIKENKEQYMTILKWRLLQ